MPNSTLSHEMPDFFHSHELTQQSVSMNGREYFFPENIERYFYPESKWGVFQECSQQRLKETWICFHLEFGILEVDLLFSEEVPPIAIVQKCYGAGIAKGEILDLIENNSLAILYHNARAPSKVLNEADIVCHETYGLCQVTSPSINNSMISIKGIKDKKCHRVTALDVIPFLISATKESKPSPNHEAPSEEKSSPSIIKDFSASRLPEKPPISGEKKQKTIGYDEQPPPSIKATTPPNLPEKKAKLLTTPPKMERKEQKETPLTTSEPKQTENNSGTLSPQHGSTKASLTTSAQTLTPASSIEESRRVSTTTLGETELLKTLKHLLNENRFFFVSNSIQEHLKDPESRSLCCELITPLVAIIEEHAGNISQGEKINRKDPIINRTLIILDNILVSLSDCMPLNNEHIKAVSQFPFAEIIAHATSTTFSKTVLGASSSVIGVIAKQIFDGNISAQEGIDKANSYLETLNNPDSIPTRFSGNQIDSTIRDRIGVKK